MRLLFDEGVAVSVRMAGSRLFVVQMRAKNNIKGIRQHDATDCAVACIVWVARWYGLSLPLVTVRQMCGATAQGTTIKGVLDGCGAIGLDARAFKSAARDVDTLRHVPRPAILHLEKDDGMLHFVVLSAVSHKGFVIMDPAKGSLETVSAEWLGRQWSGYIVLCEPGPDFVKGDRTVNPVRRLARITKVYGKQLALTLAASILYIIIALSTSIFLQKIVDDVIPGGEVSAVAAVTAVMSLLAALAFACGFVRVTSALQASIGIDFTKIKFSVDGGALTFSGVKFTKLNDLAIQADPDEVSHCWLLNEDVDGYTTINQNDVYREFTEIYARIREQEADKALEGEVEGLCEHYTAIFRSNLAERFPGIGFCDNIEESTATWYSLKEHFQDERIYPVASNMFLMADVLSDLPGRQLLPE